MCKIGMQYFVVLRYPMQLLFNAIQPLEDTRVEDTAEETILGRRERFIPHFRSKRLT